MNLQNKNFLNKKTGRDDQFFANKKTNPVC